MGRTTKVSWDEAAEIRARMWQGEPVKDIAKAFGMSPAVIYKIRQGRLWPDIQWPDGSTGAMPIYRERELYRDLIQHREETGTRFGSVPLAIRQSSIVPPGDEYLQKAHSALANHIRDAIQWDKDGRPGSAERAAYHLQYLDPAFDRQAWIENSVKAQKQYEHEQDEKERAKHQKFLDDWRKECEENGYDDWEHHPDNTSENPPPLRVFKIFVKGKFNIEQFLECTADEQSATVEFLQGIAGVEKDPRQQAALAGLQLIKEKLQHDQGTESGVQQGLLSQQQETIAEDEA